jgi:hypothetical protein
MPERVVVMPALPGTLRWGLREAPDLSCLKYGVATWNWWCRQNGAHFVLLKTRLDPLGCAMPPTVERWLAPRQLIAQYGPDTRIAMVDADTMIHWKAPSLFEAAGPGLSAVRDECASWVHASIGAYQHLFPEMALPWWEYFNAGVVVLGSGQLGFLQTFVDFWRGNSAALGAVQHSGDYGSDQTPLNLMARRLGETVRILPPPFNALHCVPMELAWRVDQLAEGNDPETVARILSRSGPFTFVDYGYVWHFSNVSAARAAVMRETWERVARHYPGAELEA